MSRICVFGGSITWGMWDPANGGWVGRLYEAGCNRVDNSDPEFMPFTAIYNCGISGDKLNDVLERFDVEVRSRKPRVIVLAIGINDIPHDDYEGTQPEQFAQLYDELIQKAKLVAKEVVAITPTNVDESSTEHDFKNHDIAKLVDATERTATLHNVPVVNVFGMLTPEDLHPDGLHPGAEGHEKLFKTIAPVIFALPSLQDPE